MMLDTMNCIVGKVCSGIGKGAYFVNVYKTKIKDLTGIEPYIGTLNLKVSAEEKKEFLQQLNEQRIEGFKQDSKEFAAICVYLVSVNNLPAAVVSPCLPNRDEIILEIVAESNLRKTLGLKDGDEIKIASR